ncbi:energy-coupling factor transporter transmembrane protein EcfT [bacterium]|nr:energy-coupling factor transporter transmembrane protein EcfT [bacterium]
MIPKIPIGRYVKVDSILHEFSPAMKLFSFFLLITGILFLKKPEQYGLFFVFMLIVMILSRISLLIYIKSLKPILFLIILTFVLNIFFTDGKIVLFKYSFIVIYQEALENAFRLFLRLVFIILISSVLTLTTSPVELTDGIEILLKPLKKLKFPVHEFALMLTISLRFIPTLFDEVDKIMKAQMARGMDFENKNFIEKIKAFIPILIPLFINSFRRADELAQAMEVRCYRGGEGRTKYRVHKTSAFDFFLLILFSSFPLFIAFM